MAPINSERFEMRVDSELLERIDEWRNNQDGEIPSRAEAMRRLVALALGPADKRTVQFSDGEKVIMLMLRDLRRGLKVESSGEIDPDFIAKVIFGGHYWAPAWQLHGLFHGHADRSETVSFVAEVLDMWSMIESAYTTFDQTARESLALAVPHLGSNPRFRGFDGNNEGEAYGVAHFLVEEMNRFSEFKGRDFNSHAPTKDRYRRMLTAYRPLRNALSGRLLTAGEVEAILKAGIAR